MDKYQKVARTHVEEFSEYILESIQKNKADGIEADKDIKGLYHVEVQDLSFDCSYTQGELKGIVTTCGEILFEMRNIANSGVTKTDLDEAFQAGGAACTKGNDVYEASVRAGYERFATWELEGLIAKMGEYTRVAGAYYGIIARPTFVCPLYGVFYYLIDKMDDEDAWDTALYFLMRNAMRMHEVKLKNQ